VITDSNLSLVVINSSIQCSVPSYVGNWQVPEPCCGRAAGIVPNDFLFVTGILLKLCMLPYMDEISLLCVNRRIVGFFLMHSCMSQKGTPDAVVRAVAQSHQVVGSKQSLRRFCGKRLVSVDPFPRPHSCESLRHYVCRFFTLAVILVSVRLLRVMSKSYFIVHSCQNLTLP